MYIDQRGVMNLLSEGIVTRIHAGYRFDMVLESLCWPLCPVAAYSIGDRHRLIPYTHTLRHVAS